MVSCKSLVCLFVLFTATLAATTQRTIEVISTEESGFVSEEPKLAKIVDIVEEFLPVSLDRQEFSDFSEYTSESGHGRITKVGLSVTRGASAMMYFDIVVRAVDAETLNTHDEKFVETLTTEERVEYNSRKSTWKGGLNIPLYSFIGADFSKKVTKESFEIEESSQINYVAKAKAASELLESVSTTRIRISGSLKAKGISFRPTVAFAFIKLAKVKFDDGTTQYIASNDSADVIAATQDGTVLPSEDTEVDITCDAGFYC